MISEEKHTQADKFRNAAKEFETDNDEKRFHDNLRKLTGVSPMVNSKGYKFDLGIREDRPFFQPAIICVKSGLIIAKTKRLPLPIRIFELNKMLK